MQDNTVSVLVLPDEIFSALIEQYFLIGQRITLGKRDIR
jgi:hypothetical protein